ncbi:MAG: biotin--[acetyl-CoA-carboxylase] ligase [Acidobacteriaceae bacterium]|nr:biotin--[acetyl-CoA-carboxylase] ligase [Acidobacteriaceae bacterium]
MLDTLDAAALGHSLLGTRFAEGVRHFPSIGSTNTSLLEAAAQGAPEGLVYIADEQTAGRGRGGHSWHSAPGNGLYVSALVKPTLPLRDALLLSLGTGLAVQQAVQQATGVALDIRWPNDLLIVQPDATTRKCGGILVETAVEPGADPMLRYAVIGIGINVHHAEFPPELATLATSLRLATSASLSRESILLALLRALDLELTRQETTADDHTALLERFAQASSWVRGKRVQVPEQGGYTGTTSGLDSRGFLLVTTDEGQQRTVLSGGVREL